MTNKRRLIFTAGLLLGGIFAGIDGAVMVWTPYRLAQGDVAAALIVMTGLVLLAGSVVALVAGWIVWRSPREYVADAEEEPWNSGGTP